MRGEYPTDVELLLSREGEKGGREVLDLEYPLGISDFLREKREESAGEGDGAGEGAGKSGDENFRDGMRRGIS